MRTKLAASLGALTIAIPVAQAAAAATRRRQNGGPKKTVTARPPASRPTRTAGGRCRSSSPRRSRPSGGKKTVRYTDLGGSLQLPHRPLAVHHVAVAAVPPAGVPDGSERERPDRLGRDQHVSGVRAVAPVGAAQALEVSEGRAFDPPRLGARRQRDPGVDVPPRRHPGLPPCARAIASTIARPSPLPPRPRASSARLKRSNARAREPVGEARPLVGDVQLDPAVAPRRPERHRPAPRGRARSRRGCRAPARPAPGRRRTGRRSPRPRSRRPSSAARAENRSATRRAGRATSSGSGRTGSPPWSERAIRSRSSASARQPLGLLGGRAQRILELGRATAGWRSASSSSVCSSASGVRSSWLASATNRRSCSNARLEPREHLVQRLGEPRDLVACAAGPAGGCPGVAAEIAAALRRIASTGRSAAAGEHVAGERCEQERERRRRRAARLRSRSSDSLRARASRRGRARRVSRPAVPGTPAGASAVAARRSALRQPDGRRRRDRGGRSDGRAAAAAPAGCERDDRAAGVEHLREPRPARRRRGRAAACPGRAQRSPRAACARRLWSIEVEERRADPEVDERRRAPRAPPPSRARTAASA